MFPVSQAPEQIVLLRAVRAQLSCAISPTSSPSDGSLHAKRLSDRIDSLIVLLELYNTAVAAWKAGAGELLVPLPALHSISVCCVG